jgi:hypothetical protein
MARLKPANWLRDVDILNKERFAPGELGRIDRPPNRCVGVQLSG